MDNKKLQDQILKELRAQGLNPHVLEIEQVAPTIKGPIKVAGYAIIIGLILAAFQVPSMAMNLAIINGLIALLSFYLFTKASELVAFFANQYHALKAILDMQLSLMQDFVSKEKKAKAEREKEGNFSDKNESKEGSDAEPKVNENDDKS